MPRRTCSIKRSGFEDKIAKDLEDRGIDLDYEPWELEYFSKVQNVTLFHNGDPSDECHIGCEAYKRRWYKPDFVIERGDAYPDLVIEAKGRLTGPTRTKMLDVKAAHPELDIRFLFYRKELLRPKLKRTPYNTDWAEAHGFPWAIGHEVPEEWL